jgi:hypothetical protein
LVRDKSKFGGGSNVLVACTWVGESFVNCLKSGTPSSRTASAVAENDTMTEDQGVSVVTTNGLIRPNKRNHFVSVHDDATFGSGGSL